MTTSLTICHGFLSVRPKPWVKPVPQNIDTHDFSSNLIITRADKIYIPLKSISAKVTNYLKRIAAFKNPQFYAKQNMRISTFGIPRIISCADFTDDYLAMPRGCEDAINDILNKYGVNYSFVDETFHGQPIVVSFTGKERDEQLDAINALLSYNNGVLNAVPAFGKTVTAISMIARRKVNTLILVHTKTLLDQWHTRLSEFLEIGYEEYVDPKVARKRTFSPIGCLDSTRNSLHGIVDIALLQSCFDEDGVKAFVQNYGMVIVDECHHISSITFERVMKNVRSQYVYGLTATAIRQDGHQPIIFMQCGPIRFSADAKSQIDKMTFNRYLISRFTQFKSVADTKNNFTKILHELSDDEVRNKLIVNDVKKALDSGRTPILLADLTSHVTKLSQMLSLSCDNVICLTGAGSLKEKRMTLQRLHDVQDNESLVIIATGKYVGEGFDYPRLDTLFLVSPISWRGRLHQYAGRLHREYEGKKDVRIYDYIDIHEPMCDNMYHKRLKGYASIGYTMLSQSTPSLFDEFDELNLNTPENQIFNGKTFFATFLNDIISAKKSIVISSPRLSVTGKNKIVQSLQELSANGISITIFTKSDNEHVELLKTSGWSVNVVPDLTLCCTIIDKSFVWYGSINVLGYTSEEDNMIKITDINLANEMINDLFK